jgi:hypothetical protein
VRHLAAALAACCLLAVAAPAAQADHIAPSITATLELGKAVRDCSQTGLCARARRATVSWNASCGPAAPADTSVSIDVGIYGVTPEGKRFGYDGEALDEPTLTGSMAMTAGPGLRFFGEVTITCTTTTVNDEGDPVEHKGEATATTAQFYLPPQLVGFRTTRSGFCGVNVPRSKLDRWLQAGQYADLEYFLRYSASSLTRRSRPELRQIKLFARGAGVRKRASPDRSMLNQLGAIGTWVNPRRGGTLRIWATVGGKKTNTLRVRVLPKRC